MSDVGCICMHTLYVVLRSNGFMNIILYSNIYFDSFLYILFRLVKLHASVVVLFSFHRMSLLSG
jgi:hypothetical protein